MTNTIESILDIEDIDELAQEASLYWDAITDLAKQYQKDNALINIHTGINAPGMDKLSVKSVKPGRNILTPQDRSNYRDTNFIVGNLVEVLPHSMCTKFFNYECEDAKYNAWIKEEIDEVCPYFKEALELAREQGGAGIIVYVDDGNKLTDPVDFNNIKTIEGYNVLSSEDLVCSEWETDLNSRYYGDVKYYNVNGSFERIHVSRIIRFHGLKVYKRKMIDNGGWGYSVIDRAIKKIINLDQSSDAIASSLQNFNQTILFIKDLARKVTIPAKREQIKEHLRTIAFLQSILGIIALDAEHEKYEIHSRNYANVDTMLEHLVQMCSGACDLPASILLNRSHTAGNNKGGIASNSGLQGRKEWAEYVRSRQKFDMHPQGREFIKFKSHQKDNPRKGKPPKNGKMIYPSIFELTEVEVSTIQEQDSRAYKNLKESGIIYPEEIRGAIAGGTTLSSAIDLKRVAPVDTPNNANNASNLNESSQII